MQEQFSATPENAERKQTNAFVMEVFHQHRLVLQNRIFFSALSAALCEINPIPRFYFAAAIAALRAASNSSPGFQLGISFALATLTPTQNPKRASSIMPS